MTAAYVLKLGFKICSTDVKAPKIDGFTLEIFKMVLASFQIEDSLKKARFF